MVPSGDHSNVGCCRVIATFYESRWRAFDLRPATTSRSSGSQITPGDGLCTQYEWSYTRVPAGKKDLASEIALVCDRVLRSLQPRDAATAQLIASADEAERAAVR
jgi:hypothetical protein